MKLSETFHRPQLTSLLHESSTCVVLGLLDPQTGAVRRVEVGADMAALPDEAVLSVEVSEAISNDNVAEFWAREDVATLLDDNWSYWSLAPVTQSEPHVTWSITPEGQEF
jgi:hypothetical protein